jgi:hypothetical protein
VKKYFWGEILIGKIPFFGIALEKKHHYSHLILKNTFDPPPSIFCELVPLETKLLPWGCFV